jgi:GNAT superfamily N-acetyltransferase
LAPTLKVCKLIEYQEAAARFDNIASRFRRCSLQAGLRQPPNQKVNVFSFEPISSILLFFEQLLNSSSGSLNLKPLPIIRRATAETAEIAFALIEEYYEAVGVMVRDDRSVLEHYLSSPESPIWVAFMNEAAAGCVMLRPLPQVADAAEVKRLYVRPTFRGQRIAHVLMQSVEQHARAEGLHWLYLDTKDDLHTAIHFYESTGYQRCPRYNDNPQATLFLRKQL